MEGNGSNASTRGTLGGAGMAQVEEAGSRPDRADARWSGGKLLFRTEKERQGGKRREADKQHEEEKGSCAHLVIAGSGTGRRMTRHGGGARGGSWLQGY